MTPKQHFRALQIRLAWQAHDDNTGFGNCDCCGERLPLFLITTPLGHKTWECKECTVEWDGDSDGFNEQAGGY